MRVSLLLAAAALLATTISSPAEAGILYIRSSPPSGWQRNALAPSTAPVSFTLALKQQNLDVLDSKFWAASTPGNPQYQNFLSINEIADIVAPSTYDREVVMNWLVNQGVDSTKISDFGDSLDVETSVDVAQRLFNTHFYTYNHIRGEYDSIVRQHGAYSLPDHIHRLVDMVTGISTFPIPHLSAHRAKNLRGPFDNVDGIVAQTIESIYKSPVTTLGSSAAATQGVIEFQGQNYAPADLAAYGQNVGVNAPVITAAHTVGPNDPTSPQTEATLDIELIATINTAATSWFWLEPGQGFVYQFATHFFNTTDVPLVNSISYGWWEGDVCTVDSDECNTLGVDSTTYVERTNTEFQKIGLRGVSLLVASGDSGANGRTDDFCSVPQLRAAYPASSPFVTAVGATQINTPKYNLPNAPPVCNGQGYSCVSDGEEVAVSYAISGFTSGGGFSNITSRPSYQDDAVSAYLKSGVALPPASYYNAPGRAFPDVAAIGHNTLINQAGSVQPVGGTSASAPIVASIASLLNAESLALSGKPLGFLNPLLYAAYAANPENFFDITVGDNKCTEYGCQSSCQGYLASKGWDPVTGLGSPNYENLLKYVQSVVKPVKKVVIE